MKKKDGFTVSDSRKFDRSILEEPMEKEAIENPKPQKAITMTNYFARPAAPMDHPGMIIQTWIATLATIRYETAQLDAARHKRQRTIGVPDGT